MKGGINMSKFCGNCGAQFDDTAKVCGYCGTALEGTVVNNTSSNAGVVTESDKKLGGKAKKIIISVLAVVVVVIGIISISSVSKEPCDWCGESPSKGYELHNGEKAYVCKDCSRECAWCDKKATKYYENFLEMIIFVCDDCYEDIVG